MRMGSSPIWDGRDILYDGSVRIRRHMAYGIYGDPWSGLSKRKAAACLAADSSHPPFQTDDAFLRLGHRPRPGSAPSFLTGSEGSVCHGVWPGELACGDSLPGDPTRPLARCADLFAGSHRRRPERSSEMPGSPHGRGQASLSRSHYTPMT
jgi:hypothetical protein